MLKTKYLILLTAKTNEVKNEIPGITNLATRAAINENRLKVKYLVLLT